MSFIKIFLKMAQIRYRVFFNISEDLAFITASKNLKLIKSCPKTVNGKIGVDVWKPCAKTNRITG